MRILLVSHFNCYNSVGTHPQRTYFVAGALEYVIATVCVWLNNCKPSHMYLSHLSLAACSMWCRQGLGSSPQFCLTSFFILSRIFRQNCFKTISHTDLFFFLWKVFPVCLVDDLNLISHDLERKGIRVKGHQIIAFLFLQNINSYNYMKIKDFF